MSKVQVIRELISQGITAPKEIVAAAKERGIELTANYVSLIKSKEKGKSGDKKPKRIKNIQTDAPALKKGGKASVVKAGDLSSDEKKALDDVSKEVKKVIESQSRIEMQHMEAVSELYAVCGRDLWLLQAVVLRFISWVR